ncbi:MAG: quinolinate synthase NadA, partial [Hyphomonadaceae bacterium]|nr:quinolinate synthase NadA [Clostridia bacterium]
MKEVAILHTISEIQKLKIERDAVILAHYYQRPEVQEIADYVGDSFALSKLAKELPHAVIVFCGVHFMAESAKILSPQKTVLLPERNAGCPMADMVTAEDVLSLRQKHPNAAVVSYVNSTAGVKAVSDICCTSSNAIRVVNSLEQDEIIFIPDQNLGHYVAGKVPHKKIILFDGYCITHHRVTIEDVQKARAAQLDAVFVVHPECKPAVVALADFAGSTAEIIDYVTHSDGKTFIIGTEMGVLHEIQKRNPLKKLYMLSSGLICPNMKKTTLENVFEALQYNQYEMKLDNSTIDKARQAFSRLPASP